MIIHTAHWHLTDITLPCGHTLSVRTGDTQAWCPWCADSVPTIPAAA